MSKVIEQWACGRCHTLHGSHDAAMLCCPKQVYRTFMCPECGEVYSMAEAAERCHGAGAPAQFYGVGQHAYEQTEER